MADMPKDFLAQIQKFESLFTVDAAKLKQIVEHFVKELDKGKLCSTSTNGIGRGLHRQNNCAETLI